jgi:2-aminoadipate transaminase
VSALASARRRARPLAESPWPERFSARARRARSSAVRELLKLTEQPDVISFAGGLPAPEVFPLAALEAATSRVLQRHGPAALQYGITEGYLPLRELIAERLSRRGIRVGVQNLLVTCGAQQGLDLLGKLFLNAGDAVVTEEPTFLGALQAFQGYEARFLAVGLDDEGLDVAALEGALRARPKLVYVLPNFQNPTGVTLSRPRRERVVELCRRHGCAVVEDDPYGELRYEGDELPSLHAIDAGPGADDRAGGVVYLGSFSKTLAPGLRLGYVAAPEEVVARLVTLKQGADLHTSTFTQMVAFETARDGFLDGHLPRIREVYRARRDAMLRALAEHMPAGTRWTRPQGGLFLWVTLPGGLDAESLLADALRERVAFVPGRSFFPRGGGEGKLRLNFSYCPPPLIGEGIARLGNVVARRLAGR